MNEDKIVVFKVYYEPNRAYIDKGILESAGIPCFLSDENILQINPLYNQGLGGIKLNLFERDVRLAEKLLEESAETVPEKSSPVIPEETTENQVKCPYCASADVRYGGAVRNKFSLLTFFISLLLSVYPFSLRKRWHCFNCGKDFRLAEPGKTSSDK